MSLLDKASLIVTPNSYKENILYSVVPNTTLGDMDVVRATTATRVNSAGLIESVGNNIPRIDYTNGSCPSLLVEPQRTNIVTYSEDFTNASWVKTATITANTTIAPDGNLSADTFTDSTSAFLDVRKVLTITANSTNTASFFVKKTTGALTNYAGVAILLTGVSTRVDYGIINTTTGAVIRDSSSNINSITYSTQSYGDYWRVITTFTDNQSNLVCTFILYPAISTNGTSINSNAQGSNIFWGAQLEAGANATSYIPTVASTVTRNADLISKTGISSLIGQSEGVFYWEGKFLSNSLEVEGISINDGTISNRVVIFKWTSSLNLIKIRINVNSTTQAEIDFTVPNIMNNNKVLIKYKPNECSLFVNGSLINTDNTVITFPEGTLNKFAFEGGNGSNRFNGCVNSIQLYKTALTDEECIALTTL